MNDDSTTPITNILTQSEDPFLVFVVDYLYDLIEDDCLHPADHAGLDSVYSTGEQIAYLRYIYETINGVHQ